MRDDIYISPIMQAESTISLYLAINGSYFLVCDPGKRTKHMTGRLGCQAPRRRGGRWLRPLAGEYRVTPLTLVTERKARAPLDADRVHGAYFAAGDESILLR